MTDRTLQLSLTVPDDAWVSNPVLPDPRSRLLVKIEVNGVSMHLEAWAVHRDDEDEQVADYRDEDLEALYLAVTPSGHFQTVEIEGREYVLVATPHGQ